MRGMGGMTMEQTLLGCQTGLRVSSFALGTGRLGTTREGVSEPSEAQAAMALFAEAGGSFIDTSSVYQQGQAETFVGDFLVGAGRHRFVIASKYGLTAQAAPPAALVGNHRKAMRAEVEGSLARLRTDYLDVYMPHFDDGVTPVEEIMAGLDDLVRAGKVLHLGLSNFPVWRSASAAMLAELRGLAPVAALQLEYSLTAREADREHLPLARARGMGVMGYSPLARGALAQRLRDRGARGGPEDLIADAVLRVAAEQGLAPTAVALAWVSAKGVIPILGPRGPSQLSDSLAVAEIRLSTGQVGDLDRASAPSLGDPYDLLSHVRGQLGLTSPSAGEIV